MESFNYLTYSVENRIGHLQLQLKDELLNYVAIEEIVRVLQAANEDASLKCLLISGAGNAFCRGIDPDYLEQLQEMGMEENVADSAILARMFHGMHRHKRLIVGAVSTEALSEGCVLASACDFVVASPEARFGLRDIRYGNIPAVGLYFLMRRLGEGHVRAMALDGELRTAEEAWALGLVSRVAANPLEEATALAHQLAQQNSPGAVEFTKKMLADLPDMPQKEALQFASKIAAHSRKTIDYGRGLKGRKSGEELSW